ncbi:hypothetical protein [Pyxidicoccus trucidator]|uniref:hypothetical protein n=1 Tax=Pyxidicoccus trucidator TaxID=2709662 RepID=UPI0013DD7286|nr:hypothetical protein [Pyxidicoccus trucidator]
MRLSQSVFIAATLVTTLAMSPAVSANPFVKDVPGAVSKPTLAEKTVVDGVTIEASTLVSSKDVATLKAHFRARFARSGLYLAEETKELKLKLGEQVTGLDTENLISYTVLLQPSGKNATTVIVSSANLGKRETLAAPAFVPIYPGSGPVTSTQMEWMKSMSYATTATPAEVRAFYREKLAMQGYELRSDDEFVKGAERIALTVAPGVTERTVLLVQDVGTSVP